MNPKTKPWIWPLLLIMLCDHTCLNMTFPLLTFLSFDTRSHLFSPDTSQAIRSIWYGLCVATPHLINIISAPLLSGLSDVWGRKKILLISLMGAFLSALIGTLSIFLGFLSVFLFARLIQGLFSRTNPIAQAVIGDVSSTQHKVIYMGYLQAIIAAGAFLGPLLGGYFTDRFAFSSLNFSLPYMIAAGFACLGFFVTWIYFQETLQPSNNQKKFSFITLKNFLSDPHRRCLSIILCLSQFTWSFYYQFMPPLLKTAFDFNPHQLGLFIGMIALWLILSASFISPLKRFFTMDRLMKGAMLGVLMGILLTLLAYTLRSWPLSQSMLWIAAAPTAMGDVIIYSCLCALYSNSVSSYDQGKIMALIFMSVSIIWSFTGLLGGMLTSVHVLLPMVIAPLSMGYLLILLRYDLFKTLF